MRDYVESVEHLEDMLSEPPPRLVEMMHHLRGDILILGAGGKMGPTLARMARRAASLAPFARRIIAVSRFSDARARKTLREVGVETIAGDLLDLDFIDQLPDAENIVYMPGLKFGSAADTAKTWAVNAYLPALICRRYPVANIVAMSTGNVYGLTPFRTGGSVEGDGLAPVGEYAYSCLGRERMFEYFSHLQRTRIATIRLNYACELRYGVLVDIGRQVLADEPIDLSMGFFNIIWQGDANAMVLEALAHVATPPRVLNVTGSEILSVREVAGAFARIFKRKLHFLGEEGADALLANNGQATELLGPPSVRAETLIRWIAHWLQNDGPTLGKPTRFQVRDGQY